MILENMFGEVLVAFSDIDGRWTDGMDECLYVEIAVGHELLKILQPIR